MQIIAFLIACFAIAVATVDFAKTRSLVAATLALFILAWVISAIWHTGTMVSLN